MVLILTNKKLPDLGESTSFIYGVINKFSLYSKMVMYHTNFMLFFLIF